MCIIEPRKHPNLGPVLWQVAKVYPLHVSLHVFHGTGNEEYVRDVCSSFQNVHYHSLGVENLSTTDYSTLLTSHEFWRRFSSEFVLVVQTDSLLLRPIEDRFFAYDYVGAPWSWTALQGIPSEYQVGNGGFSLRRTAFMLNCTARSLPAHPEDTYFATMAFRHGRLPPVDIAKVFSVEHIYFPTPIGLHQAYNFMSAESMATILQQL